MSTQNYEYFDDIDINKKKAFKRFYYKSKFRKNVKIYE